MSGFTVFAAIEKEYVVSGIIGFALAIVVLRSFYEAATSLNSLFTAFHEADPKERVESFTMLHQEKSNKEVIEWASRIKEQINY